MSDEYEIVAKGKLKLKNDSEMKKKKKKKKDKTKEKEKIKKAINESDAAAIESTSSSVNNRNTQNVRRLTKAEIAFKQMQEKMQKKRILEKAAMTHKQRVEKFNEHLDGLTEHFDIPKVSWTK